MLRLTTLPIPNRPGTLETRKIGFDEAIKVIRDANEIEGCVSHIGYLDTQADLHDLIGSRIPRGERYMPRPRSGDRFITIRKGPDERIEQAEFLLTVYRETR